MKHIISYTIAALVLLNVPAAVAAARNGFQTEPINSTEFEVIPRARNDVDGYWCAAADFARRTLGAGWQQPIYVVRGYGPSVTTGRRTAVQFTIAAPADAQQNMGSSLGFTAGQSRTVQAANGLCNRRQVFN